MNLAYHFYIVLLFYIIIALCALKQHTLKHSAYVYSTARLTYPRGRDCATDRRNIKMKNEIELK